MADQSRPPPHYTWFHLPHSYISSLLAWMSVGASSSLLASQPAVSVGLPASLGLVPMALGAFPILLLLLLAPLSWHIPCFLP